jgi:hypothetical protein
MPQMFQIRINSQSEDHFIFQDIQLEILAHDMVQSYKKSGNNRLCHLLNDELVFETFLLLQTAHEYTSQETLLLKDKLIIEWYKSRDSSREQGCEFH